MIGSFPITAMGPTQGLTTARAAIVTKHGGTIDLRSAFGVGTTFTIGLPRTAAERRPVDHRSRYVGPLFGLFDENEIFGRREESTCSGQMTIVFTIDRGASASGGASLASSGARQARQCNEEAAGCACSYR